MAVDAAELGVGVLDRELGAGGRAAPITSGPPCWLTKPIFTGESDVFAAPALPST